MIECFAPVPRIRNFTQGSALWAGAGVDLIALGSGNELSPSAHDAMLHQ